MFVFNNGDRTVSVIDTESDELVTSAFLGTTASFPANQYSTGIDADHDVLWLNVSGGVRGSTSERWRRSRTSRPATVRTTRT